MPDFRKLRVWEAAHELSVEADRVAENIVGPVATPLRRQIVRAAGSIPANIAEGSEYKSPLEFARFLQYALGSSSELESHIQLARDTNKITLAEFNDLMKRIESVRRMLSALKKKVKMRSTPKQGS